MFKRLFDVMFSICVLIFLLPLFILIAVLIKFSSKGPIFYKSQRIGKNFKPFTCYKFRTMIVGADKQLNELLTDPTKQAEWTLRMKLQQDPRVTAFGKWLRRKSLDELPQFFNVLKGDLSVVGPRPFETLIDDPNFTRKAPLILSIKPGITGLWQTSGRSNLTMKQRLRLEQRYVEKRSFALDLVLIAKTIPQMIFPKGAA